MSIDERGIDAFIKLSRYHDSLGCLTSAAKAARGDITRRFFACYCGDIDEEVYECILLAVQCEIEFRMCDDTPIEDIMFSMHVAFMAMTMFAEAKSLLRPGEATITIRDMPLVLENPECLQMMTKIRTGKWDRESVERFVEQTVAALKLVQYAFACKD